MFEKDKYGYPLENCDVVITLKDNQIFRGKYDPAIGFMTSDGRMIWKENVLSYKIIKEKTMFEKEAEFEKEAKEYSIENYETCLYDDFPYTNDARAREQSFKDGAEFGYNKANEWHKQDKELIGELISSLSVVGECGEEECELLNRAKQFLKDSVE